ncbi:hypothetical protein HYE82_22115 [Streptomyces sp. BR123]|uniref:hypothetical protein n=1 Tax=Streptomyces sp. BR123 TaxID=2749828 RepID=UPI0015C47415|nr:hypothetical protein [Streptomyces sp. BR123]NXY97027.1 hypothetical protein [Streptomyces sp. BR123]
MKHDETTGPGEGLTTEELARPHTDADPDTATESAEGRPLYPGDATGTDDETGSRDRPDLQEEDGGPDAADTGGLTAAAARTDATDETAGADETEAGRTGAGETTGAGTAEADATPLMPESEAADFRDQWSRIQAGFVDDPKESVRAADGLVAAVMQHLAGTFASHKEDLEHQWSSGGEVATEDLRLALQRYRSFFNRLLST